MSNEPGGSACGRGLTITRSRFTTNEGGGLAVFNGDLEVTESNFTGNSGTAVYFELASAEEEGGGGGGGDDDTEDVFFKVRQRFVGALACRV